jgi:hypothetical protein
MLKCLNTPKNIAILLSFTCALLSLNTALAQTRKDSLIVFVGEKISVVEDPEELSFNRRFRAKYRILEMVHGSHTADTIEFLAYVHEGPLAFDNYSNVLLFVSNHDGQLYHEKYQFFDVYKARNGKWASPYPTADYNHPFKDSITVKPEKINFPQDLKYSLKPSFQVLRRQDYTAPFYRIVGDYAVPVYGNYVEDLFKLKMETTLKARGIF